MEVNFKSKICVCHQGLFFFLACYLFQRSLEPVGQFVYLRAFFEHLQLCFYVVYPFGFFIIIFSFSYFAPKSFCLLASGCWYGFTHFPPNCWQDFFRCPSCHAFSGSSANFLMFRFSLLACCRSLFICDSSLSSHPDFDFMSVVFKGTPIFSLTNFTHYYISYELFKPALADSFSLEFEWQQISSSLQDFSQYSGWS